MTEQFLGEQVEFFSLCRKTCQAITFLVMLKFTFHISFLQLCMYFCPIFICSCSFSAVIVIFKTHLLSVCLNVCGDPVQYRICKTERPKHFFVCANVLI